MLTKNLHHTSQPQRYHLSTSEISPFSLRDIWLFPKIVGFPPKSSIFIGFFHYFHHPFWGFYPYFWFNTHISTEEPGVNVSQLPFWYSNDITTIPVLEVRWTFSNHLGLVRCDVSKKTHGWIPRWYINPFWKNVCMYFLNIFSPLKIKVKIEKHRHVYIYINVNVNEYSVYMSRFGKGHIILYLVYNIQWHVKCESHLVNCFQDFAIFSLQVLNQSPVRTGVNWNDVSKVP